MPQQSNGDARGILSNNGYRMPKPQINLGTADRMRAPDAAPRRWLMLVHQLPPVPTNLRVRTWRRLQELGAIAVKQSVYVLPDTPGAREDFEWLRVEIEGAGGEAVVYAANHVDAAAEAELVDQFRQTRQQAYTELASDLQRLQRGRTTPQESPARRRDLARYRERLAAIERIDFFGSAGRDRVVSLLNDLQAVGSAASPRTGAGAKGGSKATSDYTGRVWATRPRPGVDRMASAWLIRRFIDSAARFAFITDARNAGDALPFDMFGAGFGHEGDRCTFETLSAQFAISDPAVARIAGIVHDLDLKDGKFGAPEAATLGVAIDGLQLSSTDDAVLLEQGITLFEALYRSFSESARPARPRSVVTVKAKAKRRK
jgi:hypothetical protein